MVEIHTKSKRIIVTTYNSNCHNTNSFYFMDGSSFKITSVILKLSGVVSTAVVEDIW